MSFGKSQNHSSSTEAQQSTSSQAFDPQIMALLQGNYGRAQGLANTPYQPYSGQLVAGFNQDQTNAQQMGRDFANGNVGAGILGQAVGAAQGAAGYHPQTVSASGYTPTMANTPGASTAYGIAAQTGGYNPAATVTGGQSTNANAAQINRGDIQNVSAGNGIDASQIQRYLNPYTDSVVNTTASDLERQRQIEQVQNAGQATRAHAFNGTGAAVLANGTNDSFARALASQIAQLRSSGYAQALGQANNDQQLGFQAQLANQGVDANVAGQNAGYQQQTGLTNAANANQMAQFNATAQNQGNQYNAGQQQQNQQFDAGLLQQTGLANQNAENSTNQLNANLAAQQAAGNQNAANQAGAFNATNQQGAALANQSAGLAGAGLNLQGAGALSGMSDQQRAQALQSAGLLGSIGDAQQQNQQQMLDALLAQYNQGQQYPITMQQLLNQSAGLLGNSPLTQQQSTGNSNSRASGWSMNGSIPIVP